jgi:hypothetical protein
MVYTSKYHYNFHQPNRGHAVSRDNFAAYLGKVSALIF